MIRPSRWRLDRRIFFRQSFTLLPSCKWLSAISVMPAITFMGVRISWLIRERKSDFAILACFAASSAALSISVRSSSLLCNSRSSVISVMSINTVM